MNPRTPPRFRVYLYSLCLLLCLVGLLQVSTLVSSSHSPNPYSVRTSVETTQHRITFAPYQNDASPSLMNLFLQVPADKIAARVMVDTTDGKSTSIVIMLADQADVSAAYAMMDQDARGWYVYNTLTEHAARTQVGLQSFLKTEGVTYQSFWAANMIVATANRSLVDKLAARADVAESSSTREYFPCRCGAR